MYGERAASASWYLAITQTAHLPRTLNIQFCTLQESRMATLVRFVGGPFAGQAVASTAIDADPIRATGAVMAEMAYHDSSSHPPAAGSQKWVLCRVHSGKAAGPH